MPNTAKSRFHLPQLRRLLCGTDKIPADFTCAKEIEVPAMEHDPHGYYRTGVYFFRVLSTAVASFRADGKKYRKSSQHRVYVKCPHCGKLVPAGRIAQHQPACEQQPR